MQSPTDLNESDTDDSFMKRLILHNRSISEDSMRPQAFSKAQVRPRNNRLTLANLERLPVPEPPQVTTKSDLGSIDSQSSGEKPRNRLEAIRQRELDIGREDDSDASEANVQDSPSRPPTAAPPPVPPPELEPHVRAAHGDESSDITRIRKMGNHLRSLSANIDDVKTGLDNITKLTRTAQNGSAIVGSSTAQLGDDEVFQAVKRASLARLWEIRWWILIMAAIPLYAMLECVACLIWCRPVIADGMDGFGIYPDAPELPFVIPTMLLRPFAPIWKPLLLIIKPLITWIAQLCTYLIGGGHKDYVLLV
ncbi:uncharacterized protein PV09_00948 [Verruconis gallopava]|uniref:Uncharacterized protein n=1 Tax=Verruconis gallopava TaxID=253628 RepID=A0A0D1Z4Z5_9PEZI|nr:uncharacterized protein PV09_00948 [Verruconis gallopava]KIW08002.1 hypothetical protein PV09_00948 [Verruconis gallopava]